MKHVLFDVDGVLVDGFNAPFPRRFLWSEKLEEDIGLSPDVLNQQFFPNFFPDVLLGKVELATALSSFLEGVGSSVVPEDLIEYWLEKDSRVNETALALSRDLLERGFSVHIATNQEHRRARYLWETLGFNKSFSKMFYAAELGVAKPNIEFFERVLSLLDAQASDVCLIDDSRENISAVEELGMVGIVFDTSEGLKNHPFFQEGRE